MAARRDAAPHAGSLYRKAFGAFRRPVQGIEAEAEHLLEVEREGESETTPFIAIIGIILFLFLVPIVLVLRGLSFAAYYLAK
jgi:hypothetical protein